MIIYLYVKTHRITGLKYLGRTTKNPFTYKGSGKYWRRHIQKHGNDVSTEILKECTSTDEVKYWGLYFSKLWNVVESNEWANLIPEYNQGWDSETATLLNLQRVAEGTHHWLGGEASRKINKTLVETGKHHWLKQNSKGVPQTLINLKRVSDGTHHLLSGEIQRKAQQDKLSKGTHINQVSWTCMYCGLHGKSIGNQRRWGHIDGSCLTRVK